jgi:hypothetical protein
MSKFFIKFVDEDKPYIDENANNKEYKNYIDYKVNKVNNLLFNNQDKIIASIDACLKGGPSGLLKMLHRQLKKIINSNI